MNQQSNTLLDASNNKQVLTSFVNSVADMEESLFTLNEAAKKCRQDAKKLEECGVNNLNRTNNEFKKREEIYQNTLNYKKSIDTYYKYRKSTKSAGRFWGELFTFVFIYGIIAGVASPLLSSALGALFLGTKFEDFNDTFVLPLLIVFLFVYYAIFKSIKYNEYLEIFKRASESMNNAKKNFEQAHETLQCANQKYQDSKIVVPCLLKKAEELEKAADNIQKNLEKCYSLDIIPPSYRKLVCVSLINEMFINDKADTMREAVLLCDTEIRHGQLMNKLDDIYHSLQTLAMSILFMGDILQRINSNISLISQNVAQIANHQEHIAYVAESIKKSSENTDFYIAQRRAGTI